MSTAARIFCVAAVLGLSLALLDSVALQGTVLLAALAATAVAADVSSRLPEFSIVAVEGALAALVVGMALPQGVLLLPYLVVPALIAGVTLGTWRVLTVVAIETLALVTVVSASGQIAQIDTLSEIVGPWLLTTLGVGLLGARLRVVRTGSGLDPDASYESATTAAVPAPYRGPSAVVRVGHRGALVPAAGHSAPAFERHPCRGVRQVRRRSPRPPRLPRIARTRGRSTGGPCSRDVLGRDGAYSGDQGVRAGQPATPRRSPASRGQPHDRPGQSRTQRPPPPRRCSTP